MKTYELKSLRSRSGSWAGRDLLGVARLRRLAELVVDAERGSATASAPEQLDDKEDQDARDAEPARDSHAAARHPAAPAARRR